MEGMEARRQQKLLQEKMRTLEQMLYSKNAENQQLKSLIEGSDLQAVKSLSDQLGQMKREREQLLQSIEREEENIANVLRQKLTQKVREKVDLENTFG